MHQDPLGSSLPDPLDRRIPLGAAPPRQDTAGTWWLSRMADVSAVLRHPTTQVDQRVFHQIDRITRALGRSYPALEVLFNVMILADGERHAALRKEAERIVRAVPEALPQVDFHGLLDRNDVASDGAAELDVIGAFIDPCMNAWRAAAFDLDPAKTQAFCEAVDALMLVHTHGLMYGGMDRLNAAAARAEQAYRDARRLGADPLETADFVRFGVASIAVGTLQGFCANALCVLAGDQALQDELRAEPDLLPRFTLEAERTCNAFRFLQRDIGAQPLTAGDLALPPGARVVLDLTSANRDPAAWDDPDRFDMHRPRRPHLAFSAGAHACLGIQSTRRFTPRFLQAVLGRYHLRPGRTPPAWTPNWILHSPVVLPLIVEPVAHG